MRDAARYFSIVPNRASVLPSEGTILGGKYTVGRLLGRGGMGAVFQAVHNDLGNPVAVKLLLDLEDDTPETKARFLQEARLSGRLSSEHAVRTTNVGMWNDAPYLVMEYLQGEDSRGSSGAM